MNEELLCRYCQESIELPREIESVISPCRCRGSLELVHVECFNKWGKSKCEVCKFNYFASNQPPENNIIRYPNLEAFIIYESDGESDGESDVQRINIERLRFTVPDTEVPELITNFISGILPLCPEIVNDFPFKRFYEKLCVLVCIWMYRSDVFKNIYTTTSIYLWILNQSIAIPTTRSNSIFTIILLSIYAMSSLVIMPILCIYYYLETISLQKMLGYIALAAICQEILEVWNLYDNPICTTKYSSITAIVYNFLYL